MSLLTPALGVPGYSFTDLHDSDRLASLYERFCEEVKASDPLFWREWDAYRQSRFKFDPYDVGRRLFFEDEAERVGD